MLIPKEGRTVLLPRLKSNYLGFEIFTFLETKKSITILRTLSKKGMQFSLKFHRLAEPVRGKNFWESPYSYQGYYPLKIPVHLTISCKKEFSKLSEWKKIVAFKELTIIPCS